MSTTLQEMTQDMQARIRELAYVMWESAGRQQGMAMEYWLKAEGEVLSTMQAAANRMMPAGRSVKTTAETRPAAIAAVPVPVADPVRVEAVGALPPPPAPAPVSSEKPAARKTAVRGRSKT